MKFLRFCAFHCVNQSQFFAAKAFVIVRKGSQRTVKLHDAIRLIQCISSEGLRFDGESIRLIVLFNASIDCALQRIVPNTNVVTCIKRRKERKKKGRKERKKGKKETKKQGKKEKERKKCGLNLKLCEVKKKVG